MSEGAGAANAGVGTLVWLLTMAYEGAHAEHALLVNLASVPDEAWDARPAGVERSIRDMVFHVAECKFAYENWAFGDASWSWRRQIPEPRAALMAWLDEGHRRFVASVARLSDAQLDEDRLTNWGEWMPTRRIIEIMIAHDYYHAGEINHLRSMISGHDRWAFANDVEEPA